jgi:hypothetical protein
MSQGFSDFVFLVALIFTGALFVRVRLWIQDKRMLTATHSFNGKTWTLQLERRVHEGSVECIVTDPMGGRSRQSFAQTGGTVSAEYPDDFSGYNSYVKSKKPWGTYEVVWQTYRLKDGKLKRAGRARDSFTFQPLSP